MKKENRKMAQQRRAEERRKKERHRKIKKGLAIGLPILAVAILIIVLVVYSKSESQNTNTDSTEDTQTSETGTSDTPEYSTDTSLTIEDGDTVNIDYVGSVDGVEFEGGNTQGAGTDLVIGSGSYIDDFEEQLIGAHPGDTVEVNVTFPDPYQNNTDLSGKEAVFEVTVNGIYE